MNHLFLYNLIFLSFLVPTLHAQHSNLIPNYSFETFSVCPQDYTHWNSTYRTLTDDWVYPTKGTPDYFNRCSHGIAGVPTNFAGITEPFEGNAYAGVIARGSRANYREYIATKLNEPLVKGVKYCLKFKFKLSNYSRYAVQDMGAYISKTTLRTEDDGSFGIKPQITNPENNWLDNKIDWGTFCGTFVAEGGEIQLILGNFNLDDSTQVVETDISDVHPKRVKDYAYYYIDNVELVAIRDCYVCSCSFDNFVDATIDAKPVSVFGTNDGAADLNVQVGTPPFKYSWSNGENSEDISELYAGYYFVEVADANNCKYSFDITIEQPDTVFADIEMGIPKILKSIFFEFDQDVFITSSYKQLNDLVNYMKYNSSIEIQISGHTDEKGKTGYNQELSEKRALAVVDYLVHKGIDEERLKYKGYGENRPIAENTTETGRQLNRRVEFEIIKK